MYVKIWNIQGNGKDAHVYFGNINVRVGSPDIIITTLSFETYNNMSHNSVRNS